MHASSVAKILDLVVGNVNDKGIISTLPVIDILIQVLGFTYLQVHICRVVDSMKNCPFWRLEVSSPSIIWLLIFFPVHLVRSAFTYIPYISFYYVERVIISFYLASQY